MPGLIAQPLVENAVAYGVAPRAAGGRLVIHEEHPVVNMFDPFEDNPYEPTLDYFREAPLKEQGSTIMEEYGREAGRGRKQPAIYVFAREGDGSERLLNSIGLRPELASILNMIGKHRARKFATSMQF